MKISGFTIVRNIIKFNYPAIESIRSILPICDEFIINVGDSEDDTLKLVKSIADKKIRIIQNKWDISLGSQVLSFQTNLALKECRGDWAFYLQSDEVIHEADLDRLYRLMKKHLHNKRIDALRFKWLHFYGSYYRYRIDRGWYQKQDRIIRNNGEIESFSDAYAFRRKDGRPLRRENTGCLLYHYGWVHSEEMMRKRRINAGKIGFLPPGENASEARRFFDGLGRFPVYFGTHPVVMKKRIANHPMSKQDKAVITRKYWWHPARIFNLRYKTGRRIKENLG